MEFTLKRNVQVVAYVLLALVVTQAVFTVLFGAGISGPGPYIWGVEVVLFSFLAAFAGAAMLQAKRFHLGWAAIALGSVLNVVQVTIGLTLFGPFGGVAKEVEAAGPLIGAIVAFSFMVYNAAKILLGLAALVFGKAKMNAGSKTLGGLTALVGGVAIVANSLLIIFGRESFLPPPVGGASGVIALSLIHI